ncbi:hypothetical protein FQN60_007080, partial [Etheostoma spectabile]
MNLYITIQWCFQRAWIGLYDDVNSWRWSLTDTGFYQPGETEFRRWWTGEPNNYKSKEHCTQMGFDGLWNDVSCENSLKAVCVHVTGPNVTFILTDISMTWPAAQSYCRQRYTDLASVRNSRENQKVQELIPTNGSVFIGLFRDTWKWSDGSASSFRYWNLNDKEPNNNDQREACVAADFSRLGQWEDWNCDFKRAFVCFGPRPASKRVIRLRLKKKNSSLDVNDPAVMEAMLKQLQQKLGARGLDIKLSWRKQADGQRTYSCRAGTRTSDRCWICSSVSRPHRSTQLATALSGSASSSSDSAHWLSEGPDQEWNATKDIKYKFEAHFHSIPEQILVLKSSTYSCISVNSSGRLLRPRTELATALTVSPILLRKPGPCF